MIVKGETRSYSSKYAQHLVSVSNNEEVRIIDSRGLAATDVRSALMEMDAYAIGTRCKKALFSVAARSRDGVPTTMQHALRVCELIEERYPDLKGKPRIIVEHTKDGHPHFHPIWARCEPGKAAANMPWTKANLMHVSAQMFTEMNQPIPEKIKAFVERSADRTPTKDVDIPTFKTAERQGIDARDLSAVAVKAWNAGTFVETMRQNGYALATGDRRGYVLVNTDGDILGLKGLLKPLGLKAAQIRETLGERPTVEQARLTLEPPSTAKQFNAAAGHKTHQQSPEVIKLHRALDLHQQKLDDTKQQHRATLEAFEKTAAIALAEHAAMQGERGFSVLVHEQLKHAPITIDPNESPRRGIDAARSRLIAQQRTERRPTAETVRAIRKGLQAQRLIDQGKRVMAWMADQLRAIAKPRLSVVPGWGAEPAPVKPPTVEKSAPQADKQKTVYQEEAFNPATYESAADQYDRAEQREATEKQRRADRLDNQTRPAERSSGRGSGGGRALAMKPKTAKATVKAAPPEKQNPWKPKGPGF